MPVLYMTDTFSIWILLCVCEMTCLNHTIWPYTSYML